jgi:hypothetical protein
MSSYLQRLKVVLAEKMPTLETDKTDKSPSVSFVSDRSSHVSDDDASAASMSEPCISQNAPTSGTDRTDKSLHGRDCRLHRSDLPATHAPKDFSSERWCVLRDGAHGFAQQWAANAMRLGWGFDELFALHEPFVNTSLQGAAWFIGDSTVTAVTADAITLRTKGEATQRVYRKSEPRHEELQSAIAFLNAELANGPRNAFDLEAAAFACLPRRPSRSH